MHVCVVRHSDYTSTVAEKMTNAHLRLLLYVKHVLIKDMETYTKILHTHTHSY